MSKFIYCLEYLRFGDITLEISNTSVHVHGAGYSLDEQLPFTVDSSAASAKFSAKAAVLRVKAPEAS